MLSITTAALLSLASLAAPGTSDPSPTLARAEQPAQEGQRPRQPGGPEGRPQGERRISVEGAMKIMGRSLEKLEPQIGDASKRDENLTLINEMQRGCVIAKGLAVPNDVLARAADDAAREKMKADYRADLLSVLKKLISLEEAVAEGKTEEAKSLLQQAVRAGNLGHEQLGVGDSKDDPFRPK
ncbi:MAG: hypothetical protein KF805_14885 [Phycisphaeraceae bacterium]|nr:hypothetical protein [Phycisphaeraceae bacterium]